MTYLFSHVLQSTSDFIHRLWLQPWCKIILAAGVIAYGWIDSQSGRNDLAIFLAASEDLVKHENIYSNHYFDGYHYYYSVLFASLIQPLTWLSDELGRFVWFMIQVLLLFRIWRITHYFLPTDRIRPSYKTFFGLILLIFCLRFVKGNLHLAQLTIVMLAFSMEAVYRAYIKQFLIGAFLLAFAINVKLLPIVLIPYFLFRSEWKLVIASCLFLALFYVLPGLWIGFDHNYFLMCEWWLLVNPHDMRHVLDTDETSFHGMTTFLCTLLTDSKPGLHDLTIKRNLMSLSHEQLFIVITCVRLLIVIFTLWFLRTTPFVKFESKEKTWWEISYLLLVVPLIFPHQQHYAFLMSFPAVAWIVYWLQENRERKNYVYYVVTAFLIYILFNLSMLLGVFIPWYNHFKILTYGALLLIFLLAKTIPSGFSISVCKSNSRQGS